MNSKAPYRIAFFGTPAFSVPTLKSLFESQDFKVELVVSQPDRPSGRKLKLTPSPVKVWALENNLSVITPESCRTNDFIDEFKALNLDGAVVVAFGQILNDKLLGLCPQRFVNLHASLLPRWRGAAPIQRSIMMGDHETGVSLQVMVKKLDAGDVISEVRTRIQLDENSIQLHDRLSMLGAHQTVQDLKSYFDGELQPIAQDEQLVTYAAKIEKDETWIDWSKPSQEVWNHIRGLALGPGGTTGVHSKRLKIIKAKPLVDEKKLNKEVTPGLVNHIDDHGFVVQCGLSAEGLNTSLFVEEVQPESKPVMKAKDYLNGGLLKANDILKSQI